MVDKFVSATKEIFSNPTQRNIVIAGSFRFFGGYAIAFYKPAFFLNNYQAFENEFSYTNAVICSVLGFSSSLIGGIISDRWRKDDPKTKTYVCLASSLIACPFITLCFLTSNDFWLSVTMLALNYSCAEAWSAPAVTMLLDSSSPKNQGFVVNAYILFCTAAGTISTFSL